MSAVVSAVLGAAASAGAPLVKSLLERHVGPLAGSLAGSVIDTVAKRAGVPVEALPEVPLFDLYDAVTETERQDVPELVAVYAQGLTLQQSLAEGDRAEGGLAAAWRWGWMYLLAGFWVWALILAPVFGLPGIDTAVLMTLTGWFISLYMGGHTVKELGKQAVEAVKVLKR